MQGYYINKNVDIVTSLSNVSNSYIVLMCVCVRVSVGVRNMKTENTTLVCVCSKDTEELTYRHKDTKAGHERQRLSEEHITDTPEHRTNRRTANLKFPHLEAEGKGRQEKSQTG